ncbi:ABC transporter permease, partial [Marinobacter sp. Z-F4-2]
MPSPDSSEQTDPQQPTSSPGSVTVEAGTLSVNGDWLLSHYRSLASLASSMSPRDMSKLSIDLSGLTRIDTAGASQL